MVYVGVRELAVQDFNSMPAAPEFSSGRLMTINRPLKISVDVMLFHLIGKKNDRCGSNKAGILYFCDRVLDGCRVP